jgi:hypothetical protein
MAALSAIAHAAEPDINAMLLALEQHGIHVPAEAHARITGRGDLGPLAHPRPHRHISGGDLRSRVVPGVRRSLSRSAA